MGKDITKASSWKEAIKTAELDWTVEKHQLGRGEILVPAWGLFRADNKKWIGGAGKDFTPVQNNKAFDWVDSLVNTEGGAKYVRAGALDGDSTIFCLARLPEEIRIKGTDDVTDPYLLFTNRHQVGTSATGKLLMNRLICSNGMTVQTSELLTTYAHRANVEARMEAGKESLLAARGQIKDLNSLMNILASTKVTMKVVEDVIRATFPKIEESPQQQNKARDILNLFEDNDNGAFAGQAGSAYALVNAFTRYTDHEAPVRKTDEAEDLLRARAALFGAGEAFKFAAMTALVTALGRHSLASFSDKETASIGIW